MNILIVAPHYPFFDRASGDLRFFQIIKALLPGNRLWFCPLAERFHAAKIGDEENQRYRGILRDMGVQVALGGPREVLRTVAVDAVFFEFYFAAQDWIDEVRVWRPRARVLVDSVDVHYHRLQAKARLTGETADAESAAKVRGDELAVYAGADVVVVVSEDDGKLLERDLPDTRTAIIPNIHVIHPPVARVDQPVLTFVGGFAHEPNTDAVLYFCRDILPLIVAEVPDVVFNVIGNAPPPEVSALASDRIRVLGYVPDTLPYLSETLISVAPLRYGAGMKGKVGEAMALGLPVVTTSVGAEGIGLTPGENVLVGETPGEFAQHVIRLIRDRDYCERIRMGGHALIRAKYSDQVVMRQVVELFATLPALAVKSLPLPARLARRAMGLLRDRILWRFRRGG